MVDRQAFRDRFAKERFIVGGVPRQKRTGHFQKTKLAFTGSDADLDRAIIEVCEKMKADRDKSRVAFYYLLVEKYGKLAVPCFIRAAGG